MPVSVCAAARGDRRQVGVAAICSASVGSHSRHLIRLVGAVERRIGGLSPVVVGASASTAEEVTVIVGRRMQRCRRCHRRMMPVAYITIAVLHAEQLVLLWGRASSGHAEDDVGFAEATV